MTQIKQTDHELFLQLFLQHERALRAYARTLLPSWQDVDEVMQESSLIAWRKFDSFAAGTNFGSWLATILRFEALKIRRAKQRDRLVLSEEVVQLLETEGLDDLETLEQQRTALERCLERLSDAQRTLLTVSYGSGQPFREVARASGHTVDAFYKILQRLRAALLRCAQRELGIDKT